MLVRQTWWVLRKDLLVEWRSPSRFTSVLFFAFAIVLLVAFATNGADLLRRQAGATLWIGLLLASTRALDQSFAAEMEHGALDGLVLWPVSSLAIFFGKALSNALLLLTVALVLTPLTFAICDVRFSGDPSEFILFLVLGCTGIAAPGTLMAAISAQARGASVLLPLLLFPLVMPALLAVARGSSLVIQPDAMDESTAWLVAIATFNVIHWPLSALLFSPVVEGGTT